MRMSTSSKLPKQSEEGNTTSYVGVVMYVALHLPTSINFLLTSSDVPLNITHFTIINTINVGKFIW